MTTSTQLPGRPRMVDEIGVRFGIANGSLVLTLLVAMVLPLDLLETAVAVVIAAAITGATLPWTITLALGVEAWAFYTGFAENRYGVLTLAGHDLLDLLGFAVGTLVFAALVRSPFTGARGGRR